MTLWCASSGAYQVEIRDSVLQDIAAQRDGAARRETGGILLGQYDHDRNLAIVDTSRGTSASRGWFARFRRGVGTLQSYLDEQWESHRRYYLGEWHSHPRGAPLPSYQDDRQMRKIAHDEGYRCPEPILVIVGDQPSFGVYVYTSDGRVDLVGDSEFYLIEPEEGCT